MNLGIDCRAADGEKLKAMVLSLPNVSEAEVMKVYEDHDASYVSVWLETTMTEKELDDWLYDVCTGVEWVGVFKLHSHTAAQVTCESISGLRC